MIDIINFAMTSFSKVEAELHRLLDRGSVLAAASAACLVLTVRFVAPIAGDR